MLLMRDLARQRGLRLDLAFRSTTLDALRALDAGRCTLAGFHVRDGIDKQSLSARLYRPWLRSGHHKLIECAHRTQGLMAHAVAAAVASGAAEAAARAAQLQFIPLARERHALLVRKSELQGNPALRHLMDLLGSPAWRHALGTLPGYAAKTPGAACALGRVLPWWYTLGPQQAPPPQATAARTPRPDPMTQRTKDVVQAALA
ncbi:substrate-binding domain-containing protein [Methylibium sp.]|jgi:molybdate-binding protein|uniref:substrate-binding domain-containing protein n=1 Tax=Methylibium sp. TaxID=2067992 RepID=UPI003D0E7309